MPEKLRAGVLCGFTVNQPYQLGRHQIRLACLTPKNWWHWFCLILWPGLFRLDKEVQENILTGLHMISQTDLDKRIVSFQADLAIAEPKRNAQNEA